MIYKILGILLVSAICLIMIIAAPSLIKTFGLNIYFLFKWGVMIKIFCDCCKNQISSDVALQLSVTCKSDMNKKSPEPMRFEHVCRDCIGAIYNAINDCICK
jgi:hypothetical protein